ncbi:DNA endonuclease SmrA [Aestuariibacter sp. AA17]|uniref:DNA endonuclease SmrA n=1 Tax=Fluctibacter corallii TaxID=2984329 RepID=A0ABT3AA50_9ALTE|nr:DNA endonuclease SmrA [Aestuariibacter sp. AA17]MCV2885529.1 DNA endonuclease SmrA [Aestuariibacter sp. AA17]
MKFKDANTDTTFLDAMKDVTPLKDKNDKYTTRMQGQHQQTLAQQLKREALLKASRGEANYLSIEKVTPVDPLDFIGYKKEGVQDGVYKKLRLGQYAMDSTLNLQGMRFEEARDAVFDTVTENHKKGIRTLLIQHGLGKNTKPFPAFLKSYVNQWLPQMPEVLAFHSALKPHGGLSAVYVLLRKNADQKLANRELHRKK